MKESNFNSCSFRVTLPELIIEEGAVLLKFQVQSKPGICVDVSLNEAYLSDKLKRIYEHYYNDACKPKEQSRKFFLVHIPIDGKNFLKSDSTLILFFLAGDRRKYEICFNYRASGSVLEYVMTNQITDKELKRLEENIRKTKDSDSRTQQSDKGFTIGKETGCFLQALFAKSCRAFLQKVAIAFYRKMQRSIADQELLLTLAGRIVSGLD